MANLYNTFDQINASISGVSNYFDFTSTGASLTGANIVLDATNITIDGSTAVDIKDNGTTVASFQTGSTTINSAAVTINGNVIGDVQFNGTNISAPNQTLQTDQSLVTKLLSQKDNLFSLSQVRPVLSIAANQSGAGTVQAFPSTDDKHNFYCVGTTTASAWQRITLTRAITYNPDIPVSNSCAIPFAFSTTFFPTMVDSATWEYRFVVGDSGYANTPPVYGANAISDKGFGAIIYYSTANARFELKLFAHNGTSYVTSSGYDIGFTSSNRLANLIISTNGAGTIKAFWGLGLSDGTPVAPSSTAVLTLSGGPTSGFYAQPYISFLNINGNPAPATANKIRGLNSMLHVGAIY